jgi:hypothetical protein
MDGAAIADSGAVTVAATVKADPKRELGRIDGGTNLFQFEVKVPKHGTHIKVNHRKSTATSQRKPIPNSFRAL